MECQKLITMNPYFTQALKCLSFCFTSVRCDGISDTCDSYGERVADATNCLAYFECFHDGWRHQLCAPGWGFDIHRSTCVFLTPDFNCGYRCLTTTTESTTGEGLLSDI